MVKRNGSRGRVGVDGDKELRTLQEILVGRSARALSGRVDALEELLDQEEAERHQELARVQKLLQGRLDRLSRHLSAEQESRRKAIKGRVEAAGRLRERLKESQSESNAGLATLRKELMTEIDRRDRATRAELRKQIRELKRSFAETTSRFQSLKVDRDHLARTFVELAAGLDPQQPKQTATTKKKSNKKKATTAKKKTPARKTKKTARKARRKTASRRQG